MSPARAARGAVGATFFLNGFVFGSLVARMPAIRDHAGVDNGQLGLALACVAIGAVIAMPVAGGIAARRGSRRVTRVALVAGCVGVLLPALATSLPLLAATFLLMGITIGALDVTMNAHGVAVERRYDRPILSGFHAAFSFGGLAGAGSAALAAAAGLDVQVHLALVALVALAIGAVWTRRFLPAGEDAGGHAEPLFVRPPRRLWALGALAFACLLIEGAAADWSAVYVHDSLGATAGVAALAYTAFSLTMGVGRVFGDRLTMRIGPDVLVRLGGALAAGAFGLALLIGEPAAAFLGFAALGAGMAAVIPVVFRAAGHTPGIAPGVALAAVSSTGYLGFVAGPPTIGGLAELTSLPDALVLLVALGAVVALLGRAVRPARQAAPGPEAILSDLDGVLVDSSAAVERAWAWWTRERGVDPASLDGLTHGVPAAQVVAQVAPHLDPEAEARAIDGFQATDTDGVVALPGAAELLRGEAGPVAVVTSGTVPLATARLAAAGLPRPEVLITPERLARGKPDPEGYRLAAEALGADPAACVVFEDAPPGVAAGRAAGAHVVGILTTHREAELVEAHETAPSVADWLARR